MRCVKSGLSMMTTASGRVASANSVASRTRFRITGMRGTTSRKPMTEVASVVKIGSKPRAIIACPPTPVVCTRSPPTVSSAAISCAPKSSPDGSPVISMIFSDGVAVPVDSIWCKLNLMPRRQDQTDQIRTRIVRADRRSRPPACGSARVHRPPGRRFRRDRQQKPIPRLWRR